MSTAFPLDKHLNTSYTLMQITGDWEIGLEKKLKKVLWHYE